MEIIELKAKAFDLINKQKYLKYQVDIVQKQIEEVLNELNKKIKEDREKVEKTEVVN